MELCGETVKHISFGSGKIIEFTNNYITVLFDESKAEKKFIYPNAFGAFLELDNKSFLDQIELDKNQIALKLAQNNRINEELARLAMPARPKAAVAKRKRAVVKPTL